MNDLPSNPNIYETPILGGLASKDLNALSSNIPTATTSIISTLALCLQYQDISLTKPLFISLVAKN
jgi:hypothetical protein